MRFNPLPFCGISLVWCLSFTLAVPNIADGQTEYRAKVLELLIEHDALKTFKLIIEESISRAELEYQTMDDIFWQEFASYVDTLGQEQILDFICPIHLKYFSMEDLDNVLAFYKTGQIAKEEN